MGIVRPGCSLLVGALTAAGIGCSLERSPVIDEPRSDVLSDVAAATGEVANGSDRSAAGDSVGSLTEGATAESGAAAAAGSQGQGGVAGQGDAVDSGDPGLPFAGDAGGPAPSLEDASYDDAAQSDAGPPDAGVSDAGTSQVADAQPDAAADDTGRLDRCSDDGDCEPDLVCYSGVASGFCTDACEEDDDCEHYGGFAYSCSINQQACRIECSPDAEEACPDGFACRARRCVPALSESG